MTKTKKIIIVAALVILAIFAFIIYFNFSKAIQTPDIPDGGYDVIAAPMKLGYDDNLNSVFGLDTPKIDPNRFDEENIASITAAPDYENIDISVDFEQLFGDDSVKYDGGDNKYCNDNHSDYEYDNENDSLSDLLSDSASDLKYDTENFHLSLLSDLERFDDSALTITFDNIDIRAGMTVSDIIDNSYWYTVREEDMIAPGAAAFVCLENDYWSSEEFKLTDENNAQNGDIVLWVHNYSDIQLPVKYCVIYKVQISYLGCYDQFYRRPDVIYHDNYSIGSKSFPDSANEITKITTDRGACTRYTFGDISECQVLFDANDNGLMGITISYNEYYGPEFDERR